MYYSTIRVVSKLEFMVSYNNEHVVNGSYK